MEIDMSQIKLYMATNYFNTFSGMLFGLQFS